MKVSLIVSDLSVRGSGRWGGAIRPFLLAQALSQIGYDVEILGIAFDANPLNLETQKVPIYAYPCQYHSGFFRAAAKVIQKIDGDIIYAVKPKTTSFGIALVKKMISNIPLILDIDDWELSWYGEDKWRYRPNLKELFQDIFHKNGALKYPDYAFYLQRMEKLVNQADIITTHTHFLQQRFGGVYRPNGKDTSLFNPQNYDPEKSRIKYGLADYQVLMFPGAPRPYKGVEDVLIALEQLNQPKLKLVIVGGSPYDQYDQQLIEKWDKWIIKLPKYPVHVMPEIVSAAHIVVVPQRDTPAAQAQFPLKITDGMAMEKPVLATRVGDIPEILGDTGFLVSPNSPAAIGQQITWIFNNYDQAIARGVQARKRCIANYSIEKMSEIIQDVIQYIS